MEGFPVRPQPPEEAYHIFKTSLLPLPEVAPNTRRLRARPFGDALWLEQAIIVPSLSSISPDKVPCFVYNVSIPQHRAQDGVAVLWPLTAIFGM